MIKNLRLDPKQIYIEEIIKEKNPPPRNSVPAPFNDKRSGKRRESKKVDNSEIKIQESKKVNEQLQEEVQELKKKIEEHRLLTEEANDHKCSVKCTIM